MAKVLVLYHSMYGHIETLAAKIAEGAKSVAGVEVTIKRVPETIPAEAFKAAGGKADQAAAVATPAELAEYDAIIFGTPTRFGTLGGQETTVTSFWNTLAHHGMVIVPAGFPVASQFDLSQVKGGSPYGAATVAGADGSRQPSAPELELAFAQGAKVATLTAKLKA